MLIIELTYIKPLSKVDCYLDEHRVYIKKYTELGIFLSSGPKVPRTGGVILADAKRADINSIIQQDPFYREKIAKFYIIAFNPSNSFFNSKEYDRAGN